MNLVSLTTQEVKQLTLIFVVLAIAIALVLLGIRIDALKVSPLPTVIQSVSGAVTLVTLSFALLANVAWKWEFPAWVMGRAVVHGVWHGSIWTNHGIRPGEPPREIEIVLVIQQSYLALSISSYTASQDGESVIEAILRSAKTDSTRLCYVFELRRQYQGENKLTSGSGDLKLLENGKRLKGHYFTNSPTQGAIDLELLTRDHRGIDCFDAARKQKSKLSQKADSETPGTAA